MNGPWLLRFVLEVAFVLAIWWWAGDRWPANRWRRTAAWLVAWLVVLAVRTLGGFAAEW